jgi:hypothetical protein
MPDAQKPSIGRIVHFYDPQCERAFAAIITDTIAEDEDLSSGTHVNLTVFSVDGPSTEDDVPFSDVQTKKAHWRWPPRA